jgi:shikimate kinase
MPKIFLVGFMASGKTTIGKLLAAQLDLPFIDTDDLIIESVGMSIKSYIEEYGEISFRSKETEILKSIIKLKDSVISTGGGMPCFNNNMEIINNIGISYYLCCGIDIIYPRIANDQKRILAYKKSKEEISKLYKSRLMYYNLAKFRIISNRPPNKVVNRIVTLLNKK